MSLTTHRTPYSMHLPGMRVNVWMLAALAVKAVRTSLGTLMAMCQCPTEGQNGLSLQGVQFPNPCLNKARSHIFAWMSTRGPCLVSLLNRGGGSMCRPPEGSFPLSSEALEFKLPSYFNTVFLLPFSTLFPNHSSFYCFSLSSS